MAASEGTGTVKKGMRPKVNSSFPQLNENADAFLRIVVNDPMFDFAFGLGALVRQETPELGGEKFSTLEATLPEPMTSEQGEEVMAGVSENTAYQVKTWRAKITELDLDKDDEAGYEVREDEALEEYEYTARGDSNMNNGTKNGNEQEDGHEYLNGNENVNENVDYNLNDNEYEIENENNNNENNGNDEYWNENDYEDYETYGEEEEQNVEEEEEDSDDDYNSDYNNDGDDDGVVQEECNEDDMFWNNEEHYSAFNQYLQDQEEQLDIFYSNTNNAENNEFDEGNESVNHPIQPTDIYPSTFIHSEHNNYHANEDNGDYNESVFDDIYLNTEAAKSSAASNVNFVPYRNGMTIKEMAKYMNESSNTNGESSQ